MLRRPLTALLLLALAPGSLPLAAATSRDAALGLGGEVYLARGGRCDELFAACAEGAGAHPVLALDVVRPGETEQRLLVPETAGAEVEGSPAVVFEDASASLFLVWESRVAAEHSRVNLVWFDGESWSEVIEISGDIGPLKGPPQVVITRGRYELDGAEGEPPVTRQRTVLHVAWWEQGAEREEVYYTPIFLEDGSYLGQNRVFNLSARDPSPPAAAPAGISPELRRFPRLEPGGDESSVVVGFVNPVSERFLSFEIRVVPGELSHLGERIRSHMIEFGHRYRRSTLPEFAERIRSHMIEFGHRLHPAMVAYLALEVEAEILAADPAVEPVDALADRIRSHMIEFGARTLAADGLSSMPVADYQEVLETGPSEEGAATTAPHQLWIRLVSDRPAPDIGNRPVWIFLSEDGRDAVISWENNGQLLYRETTSEGWTSVRRIALQGPIDSTRAEQILRQRVRER